MMHVQPSNFMRRGVLRFSHFCEKEWGLSGVTPCRVSSSPLCSDSHDPLPPSLSLRMMSSQTVEKIRSNEAVQEQPCLTHSGSYDKAMEALSSLITRKRGQKSAIRSKYTKLERMMMYLKILGLDQKIVGLRIIHVAGTKGKGSTCAFSEAILRECGFRTGLFTSPHLIDVRERFRIDGVDISEGKFLKYFWDCWDQLMNKDDNQARLPDAFLRGLSSACLSGRAQIVYDTVPKSDTLSGDLIFYLDGAHSPESMDACAKWFSKAVKGHYNSVPLSSFHSSFANELTEAVYQSGNINSEKADSSKIVKQVLLFNCMDVRNPQILLPKLVGTCASLGVQFSKALFVPSISTYNKVVSGSSMSSLNVPARDVSWQFRLRRIWKKTIGRNDSYLERESKMDCLEAGSTEALPPLEFLPENYFRDNSGDYHPSSAVIPSLPLAIRWLRDSVKQNPSLKLQVLVTGSLHLVGDVLKLLRR